MEIAMNQAAGGWANTASATRRHDVYGLIHKGLRAFMVDTLSRVGRIDVESEPSLRGAIEQTRALLTKLAAHLAHENIYLHPAIEARSAGGAAATTIEHGDHERAFAELSAQVDELECALTTGRSEQLAPRCQALYLSLSFFVAENLAHMYREETENTRLLWRHYSDDELRRIEGAIVGSETPEELAVGMRWMLPSLTPSERVGLLAGARQGLPPPAFQWLMGLAQEALPSDEFARLVRALG